MATLKEKALAEISAIEDVAVKDYLTLKAKSFSLTVVAIVAVVAFILGLIV